MKFSIAALAFLLSSQLACAADWPQWRGPHRDGKSAESGLLETWPKTGLKPKWEFDGAGSGYSGVAVVGNVLYSMGGEDGKNEFVFAVDTATGKQIWKTPIGSSFKNGYGNGPRGTPAVDGDHVYALSASGDVACLDVKAGAIVWKKNLKIDLNGRMMSDWGYSESVLVDGDQLVCCPGGGDGTMAAFDKKTGAVKWQSQDLTDAASYSSVVISNAAGVKQYVTLTGKAVVGVRPTDGKLLWRVVGEGYNVAVIPTAIIDGDYVFATTDYGAKCMLIKLTKDGDGVAAQKVYSNRSLENHHGGAILHDGHVFASHGNARGKQVAPFVCLNMMSGKVAWTAEKKLEPSAITFAQGHFYCYGQETGVLTRVAASARDYQEAGSLTIPRQTKQRSPQGAIWAHPVIAHGKMYLRDQELLFCYDLSASRAGR